MTLLPGPYPLNTRETASRAAGLALRCVFAFVAGIAAVPALARVAGLL